ncbi:MAG: hypothetical protein HQK96_12715 [Nitrospirae bacterium]|nr:hypothetical protein [Nitrospirota bacterium]
MRPAFYHSAEENNKVMAVMASEIDIRMFVQQSCFTIHSSSEPLEELVPKLKNQQDTDILTKIIIPANYVRQMAFELDVCGFRKGDIFPDLQNLADEMKSRYRPHHI